MDTVVVKSEPMEPVNMKRKHSPDVPIAAKKVQFCYNADMSKYSQMFHVPKKYLFFVYCEISIFFLDPNLIFNKNIFNMSYMHLSISEKGGNSES